MFVLPTETILFIYCSVKPDRDNPPEHLVVKVARRTCSTILLVADAPNLIVNIGRLVWP